MDEFDAAPALAAAAADRTCNLIAMLRDLDELALHAPSALPGWSRLTIACHLRYGAQAVRRMTDDALAGRATSYYPEGRDRQRPRTLAPTAGESIADLLEDWLTTAAALDDTWRALDAHRWATPVVETPDNPDLGTIPLARLVLARLTEVEVHGTDLDIGAPDWSSTLVEVALPTRLRWLATRRTNHRAVDPTVQGSWLLRATDGFRWLVTVDGDHVDSRAATDDDTADATITGTHRDLLALLLGRPRRQPLRHDGDDELAAAFARAFPGP
jgi:uncharacterized protein (TIGR03083 family)